ncbi:hypothetical protein A3Q56_08048 [Intoshia linei]|uniref:Uncharacterized protein n=1 Tax=Intoshia linei TaxID=1819745 RepID=A0A177AQI2_9BILA|nr:hypothetical protein A3Q56_08048 [Intoshia linei]
MDTPPSNNLSNNEKNIDLALKNVETLFVLSSKIDMESELDFLEKYKQDKKSKYL